MTKLAFTLEFNRGPPTASTFCSLILNLEPNCELQLHTVYLS